MPNDTLAFPIAITSADGLTVHDTRTIDGAFTVATVCGDGRVSLTHTADGTLRVTRTAAARPVTAGRVDLTYPAETSAWTGVLPYKGTPLPAVSTADEEWPNREPVAAVLLRAAGATGTVPRTVDTTALIADGKARWRAMWRSIAPALDTRAAALVATHRLGASHYTALVQRPDVAARAVMVPGLAALLTPDALRALPEDGSSLAAVLAAAFGDSETNVLTPGRSAWFRRAPWADAAAWPVLPRVTNRGPILRAVIAGVVTSDVTLDPTKLAACPSSEAWCVLHTAMLAPRSRALIPLLQKDLAAAVRMVHRWNHVPPEAIGSFASRAAYILDVIGLLCAEEPTVLAKAQGLGRLAETVQGWLRTCAATDREDVESQLAREARQRAEAEAAAEEADAQRRAAEAEKARTAHIRDPKNTTPYPFPPPFTVVRDAKWTMRFLAHNAALVEEGKAMVHCVGNGGYFEGCWTGRTWIFTLRDAITDALEATVTVTSESGTVTVCLGPHDHKRSDAVWSWARKAARIAHGAASVPKVWTVEGPALDVTVVAREAPGFSHGEG